MARKLSAVKAEGTVETVAAKSDDNADNAPTGAEISNNLAKMVEIAENHLASQSPDNPPELSLMRVQLNLLNKGYPAEDVVGLILSKARTMGILKDK